MQRSTAQTGSRPQSEHPPPEWAPNPPTLQPPPPKGPPPNGPGPDATLNFSGPTAAPDVPQHLQPTATSTVAPGPLTKSPPDLRPPSSVQGYPMQSAPAPTPQYSICGDSDDAKSQVSSCPAAPAKPPPPTLGIQIPGAFQPLGKAPPLWVNDVRGPPDIATVPLSGDPVANGPPAASFPSSHVPLGIPSIGGDGDRVREKAPPNTVPSIPYLHGSYEQVSEIPPPKVKSPPWKAKAPPVQSKAPPYSCPDPTDAPPAAMYRTPPGAPAAKPPAPCLPPGVQRDRESFAAPSR